MTPEVRTFGPNYDAKASVAGAMAEVQALWNEMIGKSFPTGEAEVRFQQIGMWLTVAQLHATAALVYATEASAAPKKTCRCVRD